MSDKVGLCSTKNNISKANIQEQCQVYPKPSKLLEEEPENDKKPSNVSRISEKIIDEQKELTKQTNFEGLNVSDLLTWEDPDKKPSNVPRIIEKIIGVVLLGAAVVAATGIGLATFGIGSAIIGAVVGALGGTLGASIATGTAGLIGIVTLIHCGLSEPSAEYMVKNDDSIPNDDSINEVCIPTTEDVRITYRKRLMNKPTSGIKEQPNRRILQG